MALFLAVGLAAAGCYTLTPHRASVLSRAEPRECLAAVGAVFTRAGFLRATPPPGVTEFYVPRMGQPNRFGDDVDLGVGVVVTEEPSGCRVVLEALSPDASCAIDDPFGCGHPGTLGEPRNVGGGAAFAGGPATALSSTQPRCRVARSSTCLMTYAPGAANDAAVDAFALQTRRALAEAAPVN